MAKMAKDGFLCAPIEQTIYLFKKQRAEVREEKKRGVELRGHNKVKGAIPRHPAMLCRNQTVGCLPCHNGTANNPQTCWRRKGTGSPPPTRCRVWTPEPTSPLPGPPTTLPALTGNTSEDKPCEIVNLPAEYMYWDTAFQCAEFFEDDEDTEHDTNFDPEMLTDEG